MDEATREIHRNDYRAASIARVLAEVGVTEGSVRADVDPEAEAAFFVAALEGCLALAKSAADVALMARMLERLCAYLDGLRQIPAPKGTES